MLGWIAFVVGVTNLIYLLFKLIFGGEFILFHLIVVIICLLTILKTES